MFDPFTVIDHFSLASLRLAVPAQLHQVI